jgi:hypothetical protein
MVIGGFALLASAK